MVDFFKLFDQALNKKPYLRLEVGYAKTTDWMILITDHTAGESRRIVEVQECDHGLALAKAFVLLAHFLSEECDGY